MANKITKKVDDLVEISSAHVPELDQKNEVITATIGIPRKKKTPVIDLIINGIKTLNEKKGSTLQSIKKYVRDNYDSDLEKGRVDAIVLRRIKKAVLLKKIVATPKNALRFKIGEAIKIDEKKSKKEVKEKLLAKNKKMKQNETKKIKEKTVKEKTVNANSESQTKVKSKSKKIVDSTSKSKPKVVKEKIKANSKVKPKANPNVKVIAKVDSENSEESDAAADAVDLPSVVSNDDNPDDELVNIKSSGKNKVKNLKTKRTLEKKTATQIAKSRKSLNKKQEAQIRRSTVVRLPKKLKAIKSKTSTKVNTMIDETNSKTKTKPQKTKKGIE